MYGRDVKYCDCAKFDAMDIKSLIKNGDQDGYCLF